MECWWFSGGEDSKAKTGRMRKAWKCMGRDSGNVMAGAGGK